MFQHAGNKVEQISENYIRLHAIKQIHKQVSSGNVTAVSVALCSCAGAGVCSSARMNVHECTKEKVVHNDTIYVYNYIILCI